MRWWRLRPCSASTATASRPSRTIGWSKSTANTDDEVCLGWDRKILFIIVASANQMKFFSDAAQFLGRVQAFLLRREAEHCLILGLLDGLRAGENWGAAPPLMGLVE